MRAVTRIAGSAAILSILCAAVSTPVGAESPGAPVPFSADWGYYEDSEVVEGGTYYAASDALRQDWTLGPNIVTEIHRFADMIAYVLEPEDRTYYDSRFRAGYFDRANDIGRFGSPCVSHAEARRIGTETVEGRETEVWICDIPDDLTLTVWYCPRLQTPVRNIAEGYTDVFALTNIREGSPPESLFAPPPDYVRR